MNRKALLALIAKNGYAGNPDLAEVKAWIGANFDKFVDKNGDAIDVDAAWAKTKTLVVTDDEADPKDDTKPADDATTKGDDQDEAEFKAWKREQTKARRGDNGRVINPQHSGEDTETKRFNVGNASRKMYDSRVKSLGVGKGQLQPKFADADTAEAVAAWARLSIAGLHNYAQKANDESILKNALSIKNQVEFSNILGGSLVPVEFVAQLMYSTEPYGVARRIANVQRMTREVQSKPRKTGIPTMTYIGEGTASTKSTNSYDNVELIAKKVQLLMGVSNELFEDSAISVADDIASTVREAYDKRIDSDYILGDGTSTYGGFIGLDNALPASAYFNGAGAWSAFTTGDFNKAMGLVENINPARLAFMMSRQAYHQICMRLEKATSQFKTLIEGTSADGAFLGYPVYFSQVMPTATSNGAKSVYFGDFVGATMIGERRDLNIQSSEHSSFSSDVVDFRANARVAVNIHGDGRGSTYGPIVCIKATA